MFKGLLFISSLLACTSVQAIIFVDQTSPSDLMSRYNAITLNDFTTNSEVEGRLLVLNDVNGQISNLAFDVGGHCPH
jgi:hypothetical protein